MAYLFDDLKMLATASALLASMLNMQNGSVPVGAAVTQPPAAVSQAEQASSSSYSYASFDLIARINRLPLQNQAEKPEIKSHAAEDKSAGALTAEERDLIERVIMTSCGRLNNYKMDKANAQVIKDRLDSGRFGNTITAVLTSPGQFERPWKGEVNSLVRQAVSDVFDHGERMIRQAVYYYVNPNLAEVSRSSWAKGKVYVTTIGTGKWVHEYWTSK